MSERSRFTKRFVLADGRRLARISSQPIHYRTDDGSRDEIGLELETSLNGDVVAPRNAVVVTLKPDGIQVADHRGNGVRWLTNSRAIAEVDSAEVVHEELSWRYTLTAYGLKAAAEVTQPRGPVVYHFPYELTGESADFEVDENGAAVVPGALVVPVATVLGADGEMYPTSAWQIGSAGGDPALVLAFDDSGLPESAYPYLLDPTTSFVAEGTGSVKGQNGDYPTARSTSSSYSSSLSVGQNYPGAGSTYEVYRSFVSFPTGEADNNAVISSVALSLDRSSYDPSFNLEVRPLEWSEPLGSGNRESNYDNCAAASGDQATAVATGSGTIVVSG